MSAFPFDASLDATRQPDRRFDYDPSMEADLRRLTAVPLGERIRRRRALQQTAAAAAAAEPRKAPQAGTSRLSA